MLLADDGHNSFLIPGREGAVALRSALPFGQRMAGWHAIRPAIDAANALTYLHDFCVLLQVGLQRHQKVNVERFQLFSCKLSRWPICHVQLRTTTQ